MSKRGGRPAGKADPSPPEEPVDETRSLWPFVAALAVMVVLLLVVGLSYWLRPVSDRVSEDARVQYAINDNYTARNSLDYGDYRDSLCAAELAADDFPSEQQFVDENRRSREENGQIEIPEITDLVVDGERATAKVHWNFEDRPDDGAVTEVVVVQENGEWKVCGS